MSFNKFIECIHNGSQHGRHSSALSAPFRFIHGQRYIRFKQLTKLN
jgi:hypothetical protein